MLNYYIQDYKLNSGETLFKKIIDTCTSAGHITRNILHYIIQMYLPEIETSKIILPSSRHTVQTGEIDG